MALLVTDGYDSYTTAQIPRKYNSVSATYPAINGSGRVTGSCLENGVGNYYWFVTPRTTPTGGGIMGFALKVTDVSLFFGQSNNRFFSVHEGATVHPGVILNSSGLWELKLGPGSVSTLDTSSGNPITSGQWHYVEFAWTIDDSTGTFQIWVDGTQTMNFSGDTRNGGTGVWDAVSFTYSLYIGSNPGQYFLDDFYLLDTSGSSNNSRLGDVQVKTIYPDANGTTSQWTRSAGVDDYALIDDATADDDSTTLATSTATNKTTVGMGDVSGTAAIYGVQVGVCLKKSGAGAASLASVIRHSSNDYDSTAAGVTDTSYHYKLFPYDVNPGTSTQWTASDVNNMEVGIKKTA